MKAKENKAIEMVKDPMATYAAKGCNNNNMPSNLIADASALIEKRNRGAIAKCTPEMIETLIGELESGKTVEDACKTVNIGRDTFYRWKVALPDFSDMVDRAHKSQAAARIYQHQHDMAVLDVDSLDPKLAMAHLRRQEQAARLDLEIAKRRDAATWGDRSQNLNINVAVEVPAKFDLSGYLNR